jgi:hypothetical protein
MVAWVKLIRSVGTDSHMASQTAVFIVWENAGWKGGALNHALFSVSVRFAFAFEDQSRKQKEKRVSWSNLVCST